MPAKSKAQQRFFGMVHACQKTGKCASPEVKKVAGDIDYDDADDFASTKHKGLPEKKEDEKDESYSPYSFRGWVQRRLAREHAEPMVQPHSAVDSDGVEHARYIVQTPSTPPVEVDAAQLRRLQDRRSGQTPPSGRG